jgi:hypothetical protein
MLIERSDFKTTLRDDRSAMGWATAAQISEMDECFWRGKVCSGSNDLKANHRLFHVLVTLI